MLRLAAGILLIMTGTVWILQGLDIAFAPESFMTGEPWWILWGVASVTLGAGLVWAHWRGSR